MKDICNKNGFTLVELLIVIFIVGILSVTAVGGYTQYRKSTLLDFAADNIISQIYELRSQTIYGDFGGEKDADPKCFGVYFDGSKIYKFEVDFTGKKIWKNDGFEYKGCENFDHLNGEKTLLELDKEVTLESVSGTDSFRLIFQPPEGDILVRNLTLNKSLDSKIEFVIRFGNVNDNQYKKMITFDLKSGKAKVTNK